MRSVSTPTDLHGGGATESIGQSDVASSSASAPWPVRAGGGTVNRTATAPDTVGRTRTERVSPTSSGIPTDGTEDLGSG